MVSIISAIWTTHYTTTDLSALYMWLSLIVDDAFNTIPVTWFKAWMPGCVAVCKIIAVLSPSLSLTGPEIAGKVAIREARRTRETRLYRPSQIIIGPSCCQTSPPSFWFLSRAHLPSAIRLIARSKFAMFPVSRGFYREDVSMSSRIRNSDIELRLPLLREANVAYIARTIFSIKLNETEKMCFSYINIPFRAC